MSHAGVDVFPGTPQPSSKKGIYTGQFDPHAEARKLAAQINTRGIAEASASIILAEGKSHVFVHCDPAAWTVHATDAQTELSLTMSLLGLKFEP
jgi:hypothetical protein